MKRMKTNAMAVALILLSVSPSAWAADEPTLFQDWGAVVLGWWTGTLNHVAEGLDRAIQSLTSEPEGAESCQGLGGHIEPWGQPFGGVMEPDGHSILGGGEPCGHQLGGYIVPIGQDLGGSVDPRRQSSPVHFETPDEGFGSPPEPPTQEFGGYIEPFG